jgi:hypothetical protein
MVRAPFTLSIDQTVEVYCLFAVSFFPWFEKTLHLSSIKLQEEIVIENGE